MQMGIVICEWKGSIKGKEVSFLFTFLFLQVLYLQPFKNVHIPCQLVGDKLSLCVRQPCFLLIPMDLTRRLLTLLEYHILLHSDHLANFYCWEIRLLPFPCLDVVSGCRE